MYKNRKLMTDFLVADKTEVGEFLDSITEVVREGGAIDADLVIQILEHFEPDKAECRALITIFSIGLETQVRNHRIQAAKEYSRVIDHLEGR